MRAKLNYVAGSIMIVAGMLLAAMYKTEMAINLFLLLILVCFILIGSGLLVIYFTRSLHKASEKLQQIEQSITEAEQTPEDVSRIIITTLNGMAIECSNMDFHERISALEVAKVTPINQSSKYGKEEQ